MLLVNVIFLGCVRNQLRHDEERRIISVVMDGKKAKKGRGSHSSLTAAAAATAAGAAPDQYRCSDGWSHHHGDQLLRDGVTPTPGVDSASTCACLLAFQDNHHRWIFRNTPNRFLSCTLEINYCRTKFCF